MLSLVVFIVVVALVFDFINGFHDAANSIATVVSTRVLTPLQAVVWAAFFNFVAAFGFGVQVATTVGKGVVEPAIVDQWVILAGLAGAIFWDLITWYWGLPTSSSHALIGGFAGAAVIKAGFGSLVPAGPLKIGVVMVLAPRLGVPVGLFCAETAGAITLIGTAIGGIPVSTTHTITGSIMGVGATQRFSAVRWGVAGRIITAWIVTIPASAAVAALTWWVLRLLRS